MLYLIVEKINDKDYQRVLKVWNKFGMKTVKDCRNLYLRRDFLLFANVFEKFRNRCLENYSFCPSHLSAPALIWDVMLSMTKVKVDLIPVVDMCLLFKKGMRDIISYISKRYSRANNK